jgi:hypothetical protein
MKTVGLNYGTTEKTQKIQNIITFFVNRRLPLAVYYGSTQITSFKVANKKCDDVPSLPANFPSTFLLELNTSSRNATSYKNSLYDVFTPKDMKDVEICDLITAMQEAYMLAKGSSASSYNNQPAIIIPNVNMITSFFYKEELDTIVNQPNHYSNIDKRIEMMNGVASGMIRYSSEFKGARESDYKLYNKIAKFLQLFPVLSFQYFSKEFITICQDKDNCPYSFYVDPHYTECKASTKYRTVNHRPDPPVV